MVDNKNFSPWTLAIRPKTLPAGAGPVFLGLSLAYQATGQLDLLSGFLTFICALLLQISSNLINDYYDGVGGLDDENRLGPPRAVALGLLKPEQVKRGFQLTLALSFIFGLYLMVRGGGPIIAIGLSSLLFAWAYTGGPFPLSYLGMGELFAFLFFGPIAVFGTWYLQVFPTFDRPYNFQLVLLMGCGVGLISAALMGVNNLRDRITDKEKGKTTVATLIGGQMMRKLIVLFLISSQITAFFGFTMFNNSQLFYLVGLIPFCLFYKTWWQLLGTTEGRDLNLTLATVGKYLFFYSLTFSLLIIFHAKF